MCLLCVHTGARPASSARSPLRKARTSAPSAWATPTTTWCVDGPFSRSLRGVCQSRCARPSPSCSLLFWMLSVERSSHFRLSACWLSSLLSHPRSHVVCCTVVCLQSFRQCQCDDDFYPVKTASISFEASPLVCHASQDAHLCCAFNCVARLSPSAARCALCA